MKEHRLYARVYEALSRFEGRRMREHRSRVAGGAAGRTLEIGAGNGLNFAHYRSPAALVAVEPEPTMLRNAARRARASPVPLRLVRASAEALPFRDGTFDAVVATLVLCTVPDPARAASEIRRVLSPGGELRFMEHVRSADPKVARRQDRLCGVWRRLGAGCHPNRDTLSTLRGAGFEVSFRSFDVGPRFIPAHPHVAGEASPSP